MSARDDLGEGECVIPAGCLAGRHRRRQRASWDRPIRTSQHLQASVNVCPSHQFHAHHRAHQRRVSARLQAERESRSLRSTPILDETIVGPWQACPAIASQHVVVYGCKAGPPAGPRHPKMQQKSLLDSGPGTCCESAAVAFWSQHREAERPQGQGCLASDHEFADVWRRSGS